MGDLVAQPSEFALDPPVSPPRILLAIATTNLVIDALVCGRPARARDG
ncbi:hypothetical protein [Planotetraspora silvatica]|nr:hypothetical protein [Planotetraspora silvatica]